MKANAFIFARGGSKGLPGKNIRVLAGKPLIAWSIEHAQAINRIGRVIVSTDSMEIAEIARHYGAEVPFIRPEELSQDNSNEWFAWKHAINYYINSGGDLKELFISIPTTAPLRLPLDIDRCIDEYEKGDVDMVVTGTDSHRNPYFNMVKINEKEQAELVISSSKHLTRRQDAPRIYDLTTVCYVGDSKFILDKNSLFEGRVKMVYVPRERAIDIDTLFDFKIAEILLKHENE